jgi:4-hydroxy-4-methyl-2-oxoglutarate aldolase
MAEAPTLTIRRDWTRPSEALRAAFAEAPTGWVADAQGRRGALHHGIRAVTRATRILGAALPVWSRGRDNLAPYAALAFAQPGDVLVVATEDFEAASVAGDILLGMARNGGMVGLVTDGVVRDVPGLDAVGIPVFARGVSPNSPQKDGPGTIGLPVTLGGVLVGPGDLIVADGDGVVVVPLAGAAAIGVALHDVQAKEAAMDAAVRAGATRPGWLAARLERPDIRVLD